MSPRVNADSEYMSEYVENLKHVRSRLYDYMDYLEDAKNVPDWNDKNKVRFDTVIDEIIRNIRIIVEDFDSPIRVLEKMVGDVRDMEHVFTR